MINYWKYFDFGHKMTLFKYTTAVFFSHLKIHHLLQGENESTNHQINSYLINHIIIFSLMEIDYRFFATNTKITCSFKGIQRNIDMVVKMMRLSHK